MTGNAVDWKGNVALALESLRREQFDEAFAFAEQAIAVNPDAAMAHQTIGRVLLRRNQPIEAIAALERAITIRPELVELHNAIGQCYLMLGELDRAEEHFNRLLAVRPDHSLAHFNRASVWLKKGRYKEGWIEYEWRWAAGLVAKTPIPRPRWDGTPLKGRSILIHTEQGMGDVLQFMRFLPLVKEQAGRLIFACQKPMQELLRPTPCVDEWFPIDQPAGINFDVYAPLLSLPGLLGIDERTISQPIPYVQADPKRVEAWRKKIEDLPGLKVGLCWQGSPTFEGDGIRSIPLKYFAPLGRVPNVTLVSLQKGTGVEQIDREKNHVPVRVLGELDRDAAFVDRAAIMSQLDVVITSDTSIAHLAGAMGRPVWTMLSTGCDWRWLTERSDSPWYPTMRLFRQKNLGDWSGVLLQVADQLGSLGAARIERPA